MDSDSSVSRRRFLALTGGAAAVGACSSSPVGPDAIGDVQTMMTAAALSVPALEPVGTLPVCLARDSGGVYAFTLTCTHAGCNIGTTGTVDVTLTPKSAPIICGTRSCGHGSTYDANGNRLGGPAPGSLQHFAVSQDASGNLTIHGGQFVDASTRLKV